MQYEIYPSLRESIIKLFFKDRQNSSCLHVVGALIMHLRLTEKQQLMHHSIPVVLIPPSRKLQRIRNCNIYNNIKNISVRKHF